jgi:hypothetical protein
VTRSPAEPARGQGEAEAFGLTLGDVEAVAVGDGQGVAEALALAVGELLADPLGDGLGVALGLALEVAPADAEGVAVAAGAQLLGAALGASSV